jgi:hypothetical protein
MADNLRAAILEKNRRFADLVDASRAIDRRHHSHLCGKAGPVPEPWLERLAELERGYRAALDALRGGRGWEG